MDDATLIDRLGGPAKLASTLGFDKGGTQRVFNWKARGRIPSDVKLERQDLFGADAVRALEQAPPADQQQAA
jgi:hypothetical protein